MLVMLYITGCPCLTSVIVCNMIHKNQKVILDVPVWISKVTAGSNPKKLNYNSLKRTHILFNSPKYVNMRIPSVFAVQVYIYIYILTPHGVMVKKKLIRNVCIVINLTMFNDFFSWYSNGSKFMQPIAKSQILIWTVDC